MEAHLAGSHSIIMSQRRGDDQSGCRHECREDSNEVEEEEDLEGRCFFLSSGVASIGLLNSIVRVHQLDLAMW